MIKTSYISKGTCLWIVESPEMLTVNDHNDNIDMLSEVGIVDKIDIDLAATEASRGSLKVPYIAQFMERDRGDNYDK